MVNKGKAAAAAAAQHEVITQMVIYFCPGYIFSSYLSSLLVHKQNAPPLLGKRDINND